MGVCFCYFADSRRIGTAKTRQNQSSRGLPSIFDLGYYDCLDQLETGCWSIAALGTKSITPVLHHSSTPALVEENIYGLF
jgi:hypothetical protein